MKRDKCHSPLAMPDLMFTVSTFPKRSPSVLVLNFFFWGTELGGQSGKASCYLHASVSRVLCFLLDKGPGLCLANEDDDIDFFMQSAPKNTTSAGARTNDKLWECYELAI